VTHLTRQELTRFWRGEAVDRERTLAHLAACDDCGALYGEIVDAEPPPPAAVPPSLLARGRRAFRSADAGPRFAVWRFALPVAVVAAVAVAVTLFPRAAPSPPAAQSPAGVSGVRGGGLQALEPSGATEAPFVFRWTSAVQPSGFAVEVRDASGSTVLRLESRSESLALDAAARATLTPGARYEWRVVALDAEGAELTASGWLPFVLASEP
jgi:hypothetical protein